MDKEQKLMNPTLVIESLRIISTTNCNNLIHNKLNISRSQWFRLLRGLKKFGVKIESEKGMYKLVDCGVFDIDKIKRKKNENIGN